VLALLLALFLSYFDSARLIQDLFRLHNGANFAAMCKRKNEAIQIQSSHGRID
jgi:hypothetical protein